MLTAVEPADFPWGDYRRYTFSLGIQTDDETVLSGQTAAAFDRELRTTFLPVGLLEQTHAIYDKIDVVLAAANLSAEDITNVVEYVVADEIEHLSAVTAVRLQRLPLVTARTRTLCVDRLLRPDALIEIAVDAARESNPSSAHPTIDLPTLVPVATRSDALHLQVAEVLDLAEAALADAGADWSNVVFALEHLEATHGRLPEGTVLEHAERIGRSRTAGARVGTRRLATPGALVQLDLRIAYGPIEVVEVDGPPSGPLTLAAAVRTPSRVYLSAQQGDRAAGGGDIRGEVDAAYRRLLAVLESAGQSAESLIETIEHVTGTGLDGYSKTAAVRKELLPLPFTAATGTVCSAVEDGRRFTIYGTALMV